MSDGPYKVVIAEEGCAHCQIGKAWDVVWVDSNGVECELAQKFGDEEDAEHWAFVLNDAFRDGVKLGAQQAEAAAAGTIAQLQAELAKARATLEALGVVL